MSKRTRQYIGILAALAAYYFVHEGAHLLYALVTGVFRQINFMGLGVQIDVYVDRMTDVQLGIFCLVGALATCCAGYLLTALAKSICRAQSKLLRAMLYYITIEQFQNPQMASLQTKQNYTDVMHYFTGLVRFLIRQGRLVDSDPEIMAAQLCLPISMWLGLCDREPERENDVMKLIERHIRQFFEVYQVKRVWS